MAQISKRRKALAGKVDHAKAYAALDAMKLVKQTATAKFDEAVDVAVNLGIDAKKGEQTVRGSVVLPSGTGKSVRVAVFAPGDKAAAAKAAGAEVVGMEDLAEQVKGGKMDFDVVIAAPEAMRVVTGTPGWRRASVASIVRNSSVPAGLSGAARTTSGGTISTPGSSITPRSSARNAAGSWPGSSRTSSSASALPGITFVL